MATKTIPVIDDHSFVGADRGLSVPVRQLSDGAFRLEIGNLDRADPPQYAPGGVPRAVTFNANVLELASSPAMPAIKVQCNAVGFTAEPDAPLHWRLQTLHVPARFTRVGKKGHYASSVVALADEWTGASHSPDFTLFAPGKVPPELLYDNRDDRVAGGHAILTVAARPMSAGTWLQDFVHLRIKGTNPTKPDIRGLVRKIVAGRGAAPFEPMLNAIFAWEARSQQFSPDRQTQTYYGPDEHKVLFDWPDDPKDFPLASFDFGVGISQFTNPGKLRTWHAWDWRANISAGVNVFFDKLVATYSPGIEWSAWALAAWERYNGSGDNARAYARRLANSPDGKTVPDKAVPKDFDLGKATLRIEFPEPPPAKWPITRAAGAQITSASLVDADTNVSAARVADAASRVAGNRRALSWLWPQVVSDLHAQRDHSSTHVIPGMDAADLSEAVAGMDKPRIDALANISFGLAWEKLGSSEPSAPLATPTRGFSPRTIDQEWQSLSDFVRKNTGEGRLSDWARVRDLMLTAFGAPNNPELAIKRINAYYAGFISGQLKPGGPSMKVHPEMKARMDATRNLLVTKGASAQLDLVAGIGGFNIRLNANNSHALSNHSFGIAMDLDAALNPNLPLKKPAGERKNWTDLVEFLTGVSPYGVESKRLQSMRTYDQSIVDARTLRQASADFVKANSKLSELGTGVQAGFQRFFGIGLSVPESANLLALAAPPHPDKNGLASVLTTLKVPTPRRAAMASLLIYARRTFALAQDSHLTPKISGTAATTARFGFINLPAEVIAGLAASDGGKLRWLGTASATKDYMHFDFRDGEHPPLF